MSTKVSLYRNLEGKLGVSSLAADTRLLICARTSGCTTSSLPVKGSMVEICGIEPKPQRWPRSEPSKTGCGGVDFGGQGLVVERVNGNCWETRRGKTRRVELLRLLRPPSPRSELVYPNPQPR